MDKIEMSLDDIIKSNKTSKFKTRRGGARPNVGGSGGGFKKNNNTQNSPSKKFGGVVKGRGRGGITRSKYTRGDVNSAWKHDMFEGQGARQGVILGSTKLVVSNLDFSVSDADIKELFHEFGPLKTAAVHYDRSGRSLGTADIIFERRNDALKALKTYNGVPLDGRPMSILIATAEVPQAASARAPMRKNVTPRGPPRKAVGGSGGPRRFGGQTRGGRAGGGSSGGGPRGKKQEVTIDELNAELDAYTMQA